MRVREVHKALMFVSLLFMILVISCTSTINSIDWSKPILSERNPNGTIDYWYLRDGAAR